MFGLLELLTDAYNLKTIKLSLTSGAVVRGTPPPRPPFFLPSKNMSPGQPKKDIFHNGIVFNNTQSVHHIKNYCDHVMSRGTIIVSFVWSAMRENCYRTHNWRTTEISFEKSTVKNFPLISTYVNLVLIV